MELNISEMEDNMVFKEGYVVEKIPENSIKQSKRVQFNEANNKVQRIQVVPKTHSRMVRPQVQEQKPKVSYDDILTKMGMFVADGKLHLLDETPKLKQKYFEQNQSPIIQEKIPNTENSYIYNKYFNNVNVQQDNIRRPQTIQEYRNMLVMDIIQKNKINQIKSKKMAFSNMNSNISNPNSSNLNKLFNFSR